MSIRASPISKTAAILIIVIGIFVFMTGAVAGVPINEVAGAAFMLLGIALYGLLLRFSRKLNAEFGGSTD